MIQKGTKFTEEHKRKISEAHKGAKKPWAGQGMKGKKQSEETHELSSSFVGKQYFFSKNMNRPYENNKP